MVSRRRARSSLADSPAPGRAQRSQRTCVKDRLASRWRRQLTSRAASRSSSSRHGFRQSCGTCGRIATSRACGVDLQDSERERTKPGLEDGHPDRRRPPWRPLRRALPTTRKRHAGREVALNNPSSSASRSGRNLGESPQLPIGIDAECRPGQPERLRGRPASAAPSARRAHAPHGCPASHSDTRSSCRDRRCPAVACIKATPHSPSRRGRARRRSGACPHTAARSSNPRRPRRGRRPRCD